MELLPDAERVKDRMKILALFVDALGAEYLNVCNPEHPRTIMDDFLTQLGGTMYKNCYTPAPDTPRSSACMWSGAYPRKNHCNTRVKWPRECLNVEIDTIWKILKKKKYKINAFLNESTEKLGLIPDDLGIHTYGDTIYDFFKNADIAENSFNFFYLPDIHYKLEETEWSEYGLKKGLELQLSIIEEIFSYYKATQLFDYIIMFSDHGFQKNERDYEHIINSDRAKTFIFIRKRSEQILRIDDKLRSTLDIAPTIYEILKYQGKQKTDGKSLFDREGHEYILIEEMDDFSTNISQSVEHWAVVTKDNKIHWLECDGRWEHQSSEQAEFFNEKKFEKIIAKTMSDYERNRRLYPTSYNYKQYTINHMKKDCYSNGQKFNVEKNWWKYEIAQLESDEVLKHTRVVLYGAGRVGNDFWSQLEKNPEINVVGWLDLNYKKIASQRITGLNSLPKMEYDYILIAINAVDAVEQIRQMLEQIGVPEQKILWRKPVKTYM